MGNAPKDMAMDNRIPTEERVDYIPCPLCKQYSHSLGGDQLADAFMVFQSMFSHRNDGIPTQFCFDEKARDAAQILMTAARQQPLLVSDRSGERMREALLKAIRWFEEYVSLHMAKDPPDMQKAAANQNKAAELRTALDTPKGELK